MKRFVAGSGWREVHRLEFVAMTKPQEAFSFFRRIVRLSFQPAQRLQCYSPLHLEVFQESSTNFVLCEISGQMWKKQHPWDFEGREENLVSKSVVHMLDSFSMVCQCFCHLDR